MHRCGLCLPMVVEIDNAKFATIDCTDFPEKLPNIPGIVHFVWSHITRYNIMNVNIALCKNRKMFMYKTHLFDNEPYDIQPFHHELNVVVITRMDEYDKDDFRICCKSGVLIGAYEGLYIYNEYGILHKINAGRILGTLYYCPFGDDPTIYSSTIKIFQPTHCMIDNMGIVYDNILNINTENRMPDIREKLFKKVKYSGDVKFNFCKKRSIS